MPSIHHAGQSRQPGRSPQSGKPLRGRRVGILVSEGSNMRSVEVLREAALQAGASVEVVAPKLPICDADGDVIPVDTLLVEGHPGTFDAVAGIISLEEGERLARDETVVEWFCDAAEDRKPIAACKGTRTILAAGGITPDENLVSPDDTAGFLKRVAAGR